MQRKTQRGALAIIVFLTAAAAIGFTACDSGSQPPTQPDGPASAATETPPRLVAQHTINTLRETPPPPKENYTLTFGGLKIEMLWIEGGKYTMGTPLSRTAVVKHYGGTTTLNRHYQPQREVEVEGFWLAATEITVGQFRKFVEATGHECVKGRYQKIDDKYTWDGDDDWLHPGFEFTDEHPVVYVGHEEVRGFCTWLALETGDSYRVPTEEEWEYACRAGASTEWHFGDEAKDLAEHAWFQDNSKEATHPVGGKTPNAWGLFDMHGNVWERCEDVGGQAIFRGGDFKAPAMETRAPLRRAVYSYWRADNAGFRLARSRY